MYLFDRHSAFIWSYFINCCEKTLDKLAPFGSAHVFLCRLSITSCSLICHLIRFHCVNAETYFLSKGHNWLENFKGSIFLKYRYFVIQERLNKLIYGINTIIICGTCRPVKFQLVSCFVMKWFFIVSLNYCCQHHLTANERLYMAFVDLEKAVDWVPRKIIWCVLRKLGVE